MRNLGNFHHNINVLTKKSGTLIIGKRASGKEAKDYLPCQFCLAFFLSSDLWRHTKTCKFQRDSINHEYLSEEKAHKIISISALLMQGASETSSPVDQDFEELIIKPLKMDDVSRAVKSDPLILKFGKVQLEKLGKQRAAEVRSKLRIIGRAKLQLRNASSTKTEEYIEEFLTPATFDCCVAGVKNLCVITGSPSLSGTQVFEKPDLALKAGQLLKKLAFLKKGNAIRKRDSTQRQDAEDFISLYEAEWNDRVTGIARQNISERRYNKKEILPVTSDLVKLSVS